MGSKVLNKKQSIQPKRNPIKRLLVIFIALAIFVALAWLIFSIYLPSRKDPIDHNASTVTKSGIAFKKEGDLSIYSANNSKTTNLVIEVANNEQEIMKGLMDRFSLPGNAGMLFIFEKDEPRSFWMKNTYISLDIIFINSNKEIVSIQKYTQPRTTLSIPSENPAMYVLEVNAGFADKYGISPGDSIEFSY